VKNNSDGRNRITSIRWTAWAQPPKNSGRNHPSHTLDDPAWAALVQPRFARLRCLTQSGALGQTRQRRLATRRLLRGFGSWRTRQRRRRRQRKLQATACFLLARGKWGSVFIRFPLVRQRTKQDVDGVLLVHNPGVQIALCNTSLAVAEQSHCVTASRLEVAATLLRMRWNLLFLSLGKSSFLSIFPYLVHRYVSWNGQGKINRRSGLRILPVAAERPPWRNQLRNAPTVSSVRSDISGSRLRYSANCLIVRSYSFFVLAVLVLSFSGSNDVL